MFKTIKIYGIMSLILVLIPLTGLAAGKNIKEPIPENNKQMHQIIILMKSKGYTPPR